MADRRRNHGRAGLARAVRERQDAVFELRTSCVVVVMVWWWSATIQVFVGIVGYCIGSVGYCIGNSRDLRIFAEVVVRVTPARAFS